MANLTCAKSGVLFSCEHMPIQLNSREFAHPMFSVSKKKLIGIASTWAAGRLSPTENYLLYLSLLDSTELIEWRSPARYTSKSPQIIANNMESLIHIIGKIDVISHPSFALPRFAITSDTCDMGNSYHWIQSWIENYNDWIEGYKHSSSEERTRLEIRENALQKLIKTPGSESTEALANVLAEWAALAGDFPVYQTPHHISRKLIPLSDYWKLVIRACVNEEKIWQFPRGDIAELIDHCEDNIVMGNINSHALMKLLRTGLRKYDDYLGFGDVDLGGATTSFRIMDSSNSAEDANIQALTMTASETEPRIHQYPSKFSWLKAHSKWALAKSIKEKAL